VIAAGLVLMTVTAVTFCVGNVSRAGVRLDKTMDAERAVRGVAERLRALPFCAPAYPLPIDRPAGPDLVAVVFPHATPWRNSPAARYVDAAGDAEAASGSFVTLVEQDGLEVRCVARFLAAPDGPSLGAAEVAGWDGGASGEPPAPAIAVELVAQGPGPACRTVLVRTALGSPPLVPERAADPA
jgi:hypothetical protein